MTSHRERSHSREQFYAFVKLLNDIDATLRTAYGDARSAAIVHTVWLGQQDGVPYDITALAAELNFPRQTVSYIVKRLVDEGVLERRKVGHSALLRVGSSWSASAACDRFEALMDRAAEIFLPPGSRNASRVEPSEG